MSHYFLPDYSPYQNNVEEAISFVKKLYPNYIYQKGDEITADEAQNIIPSMKALMYYNKETMIHIERKVSDAENMLFRFNGAILFFLLQIFVKKDCDGYFETNVITINSLNKFNDDVIYNCSVIPKYLIKGEVIYNCSVIPKYLIKGEVKKNSFEFLQLFNSGVLEQEIVFIN
jgi:hypothetical protein